VSRVLVTGGDGFIGSHVVGELVGLGHDVRVLDVLHPAAHAAAPAYRNPAAEYRHGDVRDQRTVEDALRGVDHVCHQAAMVGLGTDLGDVADYVSHNDLGTAVLLRALASCRFAGRLVLESSMVVYRCRAPSTSAAARRAASARWRARCTRSTTAARRARRSPAPKVGLWTTRRIRGTGAETHARRSTASLSTSASEHASRSAGPSTPSR